MVPGGHVEQGLGQATIGGAHAGAAATGALRRQQPHPLVPKIMMANNATTEIRRITIRLLAQESAL
jgi:hypothetical protein